MEIHIGIEDFNAEDIDDDRFNKTLLIKPGLNAISIPIEDIEKGPLSRKLDLAALRDIYLFAIEPKISIRLYIDDIRLRL